MAKKSEIDILKEQFKFVVELEPQDERVSYMQFDDGRRYRLQHPGALVIARLFSSNSDTLTADCLDYFLKNCISPVADNKTKVLNAETLDLDETMDLWLPFAWRWLRWHIRFVTGIIA
jgi:hypothetical protein